MAAQTYDEAVKHKQSVAAGGARAAGPGAIWRTTVGRTRNPHVTSLIWLQRR
jgi:hypothetical protein